MTTRQRPFKKARTPAAAARICADAPGTQTGAKTGARIAEIGADAAIYEAIFDAVMTHRLPPGTKLTEAPLCAIFGTTRGVLRRVYVQLAQERVIDLTPNRGATVASPTVAQTHEVFEARRVIEAGLVRRLAHDITRAQLRELEELAADEQAAYDQGDWVRQIRLSGGFHLRLAEVAGNQELSRMLKVLVARSSLMIALYQSPGRSGCAASEHLELLAAIGAGRVNDAIALSDAHLQHCEDHLDLRQGGPEPDLYDVFGVRPKGKRRAGA
jgi:DNA-binding GntR family transcriptional regulator